jgi:alkylation response protein AidB-like acyl-CoA dehydrogenase
VPTFSTEQLQLQDTARRVVVERIADIGTRVEKTAEHPHDLVELYRELGWLSLTAPVEYGGGGGGTTEWCIVIEAVAEVSPVCASLLGKNSVNMLLARLGTDDQKRTFFPIIEQRTVSFMASEADAGSDVAAIRTTAIEKDGYYVLNGRKQWVSSGGHADFFVVLANIEPGSGARGIRMFLVDGKESSGIEVEREEELMGMRGKSVAQIVLTDVEVPAANMIQGEGGTRAMVEFMTAARPNVGAAAVGLAQGATDYALRYTLERKQFGRPVFEFQAVSHMIAEMATQVEAARELVYAAAMEVDRRGPRRGELASMSKVFCTDVAMRVTTDAVQCLGGAGYTKDHPVERMMRDAKVMQIYEGTNQIQREAIAKQLARRVHS